MLIQIKVVVLIPIAQEVAHMPPVMMLALIQLHAFKENLNPLGCPLVLVLLLALVVLVFSLVFVLKI